MVLYENNDDIYDNPATEAVINFLSWAYLNHSIIINERFLFALMVIFYYLATYQLITEALQLQYRGFKKYFGEIFNIVDMVSIMLSVSVMSMMLRNFNFPDGFGSVEEIDMRTTVGISFSIFLLWIELIFYLRPIPGIGNYIYYVIIIFKTIFPFFLFMLIVMIAFAHTMFVLLRNPVQIKTKDSTFSGTATNSLTNETLNVEFKSDFDPTSGDNPFTSFSQAIVATYFWLSGDMVQRDEFDNWVVDAFTLIASIVLVVVLQNMLIAFMSGVYENAETKGRQTLLRHQANHIADYEALHHIHFWGHEHQGAIHEELEAKSTFMKQIYKKKCFDERSIMKYNDCFKSEIKEISIIKNKLNDKIERLNKKIHDPKKGTDDEIKNEIKEFDNIIIKKLEN
ncbi:hypothetical protein RhiirA1_464629 [Rhizophagus irregularis]|uniref:Ion transport domain-containing protein n=1 Tax=Rhizophagus irregularis TaxID=588596 RepID=A0A2I1EE39_9GLOM|nr:hypothetical protein RhiirA1_464629 [Rhizophagus irregularis]PKY20393.1 hypothetical protein RhiirB3_433681 [Rhizophagus irregularis]